MGRNFALVLASGAGIAGLLVAAGFYLFGPEFAGEGAAKPEQAVAIQPLASAEPETEERPEARDQPGTVAPAVANTEPPSTETQQPPSQQVSAQPVVARLTPVRKHIPPTSDELDAPYDDALAERASIGGRVLDESGQPLPGVELQASAIRLFEPGEASIRATVPEVHYAVSDFAGWYEFWDLAAGEYRIQTTPMGPFVSAQKMVRTGVLTADLVLSWQQEVTVFGMVRGQHGEPLEGVQVTGLSSPPRVVYTDWQGQYELALSLREKASHAAVHFKRAGYREQRLKVEVTEPGAILEDVQLDATLEPLAALASVKGNIKDPNGRPVAGETVSLTSHSLRRGFQGVSDSRGRFSIHDVEPASDYRLLVAARGGYRDYRKSGIEVKAGGLKLEIVLEPFAMGRIEGQMVDVDGNPIPNFSLTMKSQTAIRHSAQVKGDGRGFFVVRDVPEGAVKLRTESAPRIVVSGLRASRESKDPVPVMLDLGEHEVRGWITDSRGQPIATARINARMEHIAKGVRSFSARDAISDAEGYFQFSGLGAGIHTVRVSAAGFATVEFDIDVGRDQPEMVIALDDK